MKTQISRDSFRPEKKYSGVYQQQGRMITDADWNELNAIIKTRLQEALRDIISSGATAVGGILDTVSVHPGLKWGDLYVDGIHASVMPDLGKYSGTPAVDFDYSKQRDFPDAPAISGTDYTLYADVWERAVSSLEDDELRDPGLNGADTCSRTKVMAQVKWCHDSDDPLNTDINPAKGNALLSLQERSVGTIETDPCDPCAREVALDQGSGNYLFRVEVHAVTGSAMNPSGLILKWSTENGAEAHPRDVIPAGFKAPDRVYEFYGAVAEQHLGVHLGDPASVKRGTLETSGYPEVEPEEDFVRRWDGYCEIVHSGGTPGTFTVTGKERGESLALTAEDDEKAGLGNYKIDSGKIKIFLTTLVLELELPSDDKCYVAGDYWLAQVRRNAESGARVRLVTQEPLGITHHYVKLITVKDGITDVLTDAERRQFSFPPLNNIDAHHVSYDASSKSSRWQDIYDNPATPMPETVQEAIDDLIENLESSDINYTLPNCGTAVQTVKSLLTTLSGWPDLDGDGKSVATVKDILHGFLCHFDSAHLPYSTSVSGTVKDKLDGLRTDVDAKVNRSGDTMTGALRVNAKLTASGGVHVGGDSDPGANNLLVDGTCTVNGNCTVSGNFTVLGTTTTVNTTQLNVEDDIITLNKYAGTAANVKDSGIEVYRGSAPKAQFLWDETHDTWAVGVEGSLEPIMTTAHKHTNLYSSTTAATASLTVSAAGTIGIGTTSPVTARMLDIRSTSGIGVYAENNDATYATLYLKNFNTGPAVRVEQGNVLINGASKLAIGHLNPQSQLHLSGGTWDARTTNGDLKIGNDTYSMQVGVALAGGGAGDVRLHARGGTNRMILGAGGNDVLTVRSGNVGINTITPRTEAKLDVNGDIYTTRGECVTGVKWTPVAKKPIDNNSTSIPIYSAATLFTRALSTAVVPAGAKEVYLYIHVSTGAANQDGDIELKIYTAEGGNQYASYFHLHGYSQSAWSYNSDNFWLPITSNRNIYMQRTAGGYLTGNKGYGIYVIGYR